MANIANVLKSEISRLARKEIRAEIEPLKKSASEARSTIATLRRQVVQLEREVRRVSKGSARVKAAPAEAEDASDSGPRRRFSAKRLAAHRAKLGISAADYGALIGVTGQTVYKWEQGKARPRATQIQALAGIRGLTAKQIEAKSTAANS